MEVKIRKEILFLQNKVVFFQAQLQKLGAEKWLKLNFGTPCKTCGNVKPKEAETDSYSLSF